MRDWHDEWQQARFKEPMSDGEIMNIKAMFFKPQWAEDFVRKHGGTITYENVMGMQFLVVKEKRG